jgi:hypothetical protein
MRDHRTWKSVTKTVATVTLVAPFHGHILWVMASGNEYIVHEAVGLSESRLNGLKVRNVWDIEHTTYLEIFYIGRNVANPTYPLIVFNTNGVIQVVQMTSEELLAAFLLRSIVTRFKVANTALKVERLHFAANTLMELQTS